MDDKNVVKKRVTLAIAFAVFIVVVIAVILLLNHNFRILSLKKFFRFLCRPFPACGCGWRQRDWSAPPFRRSPSPAYGRSLRGGRESCGPNRP